jgi:hypothetical protein
VRWVGHEAYMEEKSLQFFRKIWRKTFRKTSTWMGGY